MIRPSISTPLLSEVPWEELDVLVWPDEPPWLVELEEPEELEDGTFSCIVAPSPRVAVKPAPAAVA
jgi:hypothetical protein